MCHNKCLSHPKSLSKMLLTVLLLSAATEQTAYAYGDANDDADEAEDGAEGEAEEAEAEEEDKEEEVEDAHEEDNEEEIEEAQEEEIEEQVEEEEHQEQEDEAAEAEDPERKLKQQIDCNRCGTLQCFDKYANDDAVVSQAADREELDAYIAAWIEEVANCKETSTYINGQPVYIGPICSDYADTFEIGAFLDEDCTIYTKLASFDSIIAAEEANYSVDVTGYAINSLKTAFYQPLTCESQEFANVSILFLALSPIIPPNETYTNRLFFAFLRRVTMGEEMKRSTK
jgi:chemotaxis protein histidine kinase CheA